MVLVIARVGKSIRGDLVINYQEYIDCRVTLAMTIEYEIDLLN